MQLEQLKHERAEITGRIAAAEASVATLKSQFAERLSHLDSRIAAEEQAAAQHAAAKAAKEAKVAPKTAAPKK